MCIRDRLNATGAHEDSGIIRADIALSAIKIDTIDSIVDTILVDTNEIQGKLPTNYMMGSGVTSDKDDEINAIKVKTDNLPSDPSSEANATSNKNSIIAEINANEVKIDSLAVDTSLILSELETVLALLHENSHVTNQVHNSEGKLLTADLNHYSNSTDLVNRSNPIRTFKIISSYDSSGLSSSFEIKRVL